MNDEFEGEGEETEGEQEEIEEEQEETEGEQEETEGEQDNENNNKGQGDQLSEEGKKQAIKEASTLEASQNNTEQTMLVDNEIKKASIRSVETPPAPQTEISPAPQTETPPAPQTQTPPAPQTQTPPAPQTETPPAPQTQTPPAPQNPNNNKPTIVLNQKIINKSKAKGGRKKRGGGSLKSGKKEKNDFEKTLKDLKELFKKREYEIMQDNIRQQLKNDVDPRMIKKQINVS